MEKRRITNNQFFEYIEKLKEELKNFKIDYIYGIPRGGLIPAVYLSHYLNCEFILNLDEIDKKKTYLIVDDIVDTGKTLIDILRKFDKSYNYITTSLFFKPLRSIIKPDIFVIETDDWIVFPWESDNDIMSEYHKELYFND